MSGRAGEALVWYVAYGSNLCAERLRCYLEGGRPHGAVRDQVGARDPRPPRATRPVRIDGELLFARESLTWGGGGVAFHDPDAPGRTAARAHLVTVGQFSDIARQESGAVPDVDLDLDELVARGRVTVGVGWYDTAVWLGRLDGLPMLTITAATRPHAGELRAPGEAYLGTIVDGLAEAHGWAPPAIGSHLAACAGVSGDWDEARIEALAAQREQLRHRRDHAP